MKRFLVGTGSLVVLGLGAFIANPQPADAACSAVERALNPLRCAIEPKPRPRAGVGCAASSMKYIRLENRSNLTLSYGLLGGVFTVPPGTYMLHEYRFEPELDGCRPNPAPHPSIAFDGSLANGYQPKSFTITGGPYDVEPNVYYFTIQGTEVNVFAQTVR